MSLTHAKKLLLTHGIESFSDYIMNYFNTAKKDKKHVSLINGIKETEEFKDLVF
jgi:predicted CopG family antitoxin